MVKTWRDGEGEAISDFLMRVDSDSVRLQVLDGGHRCAAEGLLLPWCLWSLAQDLVRHCDIWRHLWCCIQKCSKASKHQNMSKPFNVSVRHKSEAFWLHNGVPFLVYFVPFLQCNARYTVVVVREATIIGQEAWNPDLQCGRPIQPVKGESTYFYWDPVTTFKPGETGKIESNWTLSYACEWREWWKWWEWHAKKPPHLSWLLSG